ncbi:hypothetical protein B0H19DRAFT_1271323 [Mycena capillaripes]|nr:hypothetical protein B0H19DRAFT_1271323 [Mycena capillaripes]
MPGGYPPMSGSTSPTQHDQWSGFQPMTAETQNTYPHGAQPTPGPSTTNYQHTSCGNPHAYPPYGAQDVPRSSISPTQQNHNQMSHWPNDQSMQTDEEEYRHKAPSRTSICNGVISRTSTRPPSESQHQSPRFIPTHSGYQQTNGRDPYVAQEVPGSRALPRVDFSQNKVRAVEHPDMEYTRGERRARRDAETAAQRRLQELEDQQRKQVRQYQEMNARVAEADRVASEAVRARQAQELEAKKQKAEYDAALATITQRWAVHGPPLPPNQHQEFPNAPLAFQPRYIPQSTRESRQLDTITRNVGGNLPQLNLRYVQQGSSRDAAQQNKSRGEGSSESSDESESEDQGVSREGNRSRLRETLGSDKDALKVLLKELLKEMDVTGVAKSKSKRKVGRIRGLEQAKKSQQSNMTKEDDLRCKALVREVFRLSTRLNRALDFVDYRPATDAQAALCGHPNGEKPLPGVSPLYFGKGFKTTMWNDVLIRGMVGDLLRKRAEDPNHLGIPNVTTDYLIGLFLNCIKEARFNWARHQPRLGESQEMAEARALEFESACRKTKASRSRKESKWEKRRKTAKRMTLLCAGNPAAVKVWKWVKKLLELLGALGMSSEDAKPRKFRIGNQQVQQITHIISICPWRPDEITKVLDLVDSAADGISLKNGTTARPRLRGEAISNTPPPQGLPETLYDEEWMEEGLAMDPDFKEDLMVSEEAFEIMEVVAQDLGIMSDD